MTTSIKCADYREVVFFKTERDAAYWMQNDYLLAEDVELPDEGTREVYEEMFIAENEIHSDFEDWLDSNFGGDDKVALITTSPATIIWSARDNCWELETTGPTWGASNTTKMFRE